MDVAGKRAWILTAVRPLDRRSVFIANYWPVVALVLGRYEPAAIAGLSAIRLHLEDFSPPEQLLAHTVHPIRVAPHSAVSNGSAAQAKRKKDWPQKTTSPAGITIREATATTTYPVSSRIDWTQEIVQASDTSHYPATSTPNRPRPASRTAPAEHTHRLF